MQASNQCEFISSEDLLGDDLGDHSLADYNLGNEEEEKLLADDDGPSQNVPTSVGSFHESVDPVPTEFPRQNVEYNLVCKKYFKNFKNIIKMSSNYLF